MTMLCPSCQNNVVPNEGHCPVCHFEFPANQASEPQINFEQNQTPPKYHNDTAPQDFVNPQNPYCNRNYSKYYEQPLPPPQYFAENNRFASNSPPRTRLHTEDPGFVYALLSFIFGILGTAFFWTSLRTTGFGVLLLSVIGDVLSMFYFKYGNKICSKFNIVGLILNSLIILAWIGIFIIVFLYVMFGRR